MNELDALKKAQELIGPEAYVVKMFTKDGVKFVLFDENDRTRGFSAESFEDMFKDAEINAVMYGRENITGVN